MKKQRLHNKETDYFELRKKVNFRIIKFILTTVFKNSTAEEPSEDLLDQATEVLLNMTYTIDELVANFSDISDDVHRETIRNHQTKLNDYLKDNSKVEYPEIWEKYLTELFEDTNVTIDFDKDILYLTENDENYLPKILTYVLTTSDIYLELYMWWVTVFAMIINTTSDVVDFITKQTAPFYGMNVLRSR